MNELLAEARLRYVVGTMFYPAHVSHSCHNDEYCIITENSTFVYDNERITVTVDGRRWVDDTPKKPSIYGNCCYNRILYNDGKWAKIRVKSESKINNQLPIFN